MNLKLIPFVLLLVIVSSNNSHAQSKSNQSLLTLDRIYKDNEFRQDWLRPLHWVNDGDQFIRIEKSKHIQGADELLIYNAETQQKKSFISAEDLSSADQVFSIEQFAISNDRSKILLFNNSKRVWRSNTKGDFWIFDLQSKSLKKVGAKFADSSIMFAKFSNDNKYIAYVHDFNIYKEDLNTGEIIQLTFDGNEKIINGTFDWVYEEEFGKRDGFSWSPNSQNIAFYHLDASETGTFYMINNTDSIYAEPIPIPYPKVGQSPSGAKVGIIDMETHGINWIPVPGAEKENYIPGIQWVNPDLLLIQQLNRKQNKLSVWSYQPSTNKISRVYKEIEETWIELQYPDISSSHWGNNDLPLVDNNTAFLRMTENGDWRNIIKVNIADGKIMKLTNVDYDVAAYVSITSEHVYFMASPDNSTQRYLYSARLDGSGSPNRITPAALSGVNGYNISPNGRYAIHSHQNSIKPSSHHFIRIPEHEVIKTLVTNERYQAQLSALALPKIEFSAVTIDDSIDIDVRMVFPPDFNPSIKYPVLFHVYGEPWGQVATDRQIGLWNIFMAQQGYIIIDMDNRGTPCLKGSEWRKSIYRKIGLLNTDDQAKAAKEILKLPYLDNDRTAVWGWSGGGSMTLNLLFKYPEIYKTGISVAAVSNQLIYDNIYQERYMGLPSENIEDFINGSPITYAKQLEGNLLYIHGTGDDNVHYQSAEMLINELIKHNKQFQVMPYPNRTHGIREGHNTTRHLYTLITNYILNHCPPNESAKP